MSEEVKDEVMAPQLPVADSEKESPELQDIDRGNATNGLVETQAAQYQYLESLEARIFADGAIDEGELDNVNYCKSEVLLQLVSVESFAASLNEDDSRKKAVNVLLSHLYKCYGKTERLRLRAIDEKFQTDYQKAVGVEKINQRDERNMTMTDDFLMPKDRRISLGGAGISIAGLGFLKEFVSDPEQRLKAQMPDLIQELAKKMTGSEQNIANQWVGQLVDELSKLKGVKSMASALEGNNMMTALKQLAAGKAGNAA